MKKTIKVCGLDVHKDTLNYSFIQQTNKNSVLFTLHLRFRSIAYLPKLFLLLG